MYWAAECIVTDQISESPALYHIIKNGGSVGDWVSLGLAVGGVALEYFGIGEIWDSISIGVSAAATAKDIYDVATEKK